MNDISIKIGQWFDQNKRDLPWRHTRDPYKIWLSETILQQTRVVQGWDYYLSFIRLYPTVSHLAAASEDEVLKLWQGLGYYSRARNLLAAARQVVEHIAQGDYPSFPTTYADLRELKGVGPYTAAAVASLSADQQVAVVDGNVYRVLARLYDLDTPIDTSTGQKTFQALATQLLPLPEGHSSHHNQAMMELGALCCTPTSPHCPECPINAHCLALAHDTINQRPIKQGKLKVKERQLTYIIYIYKDSLWVHQRGAGDIWQGLWEPYLKQEHEAPKPKGTSNCLLMQKKHQLTHQTLYADFWVCKLDGESQAQELDPILAAKGYRRVTWEEWQSLAVPRLIDEANQRLSKDWF